MDVGELVAREAIRDLVAAYAQYADRGRFDELVELFTVDGTLRVDARPPLAGRPAIREFLAGVRRDRTPTPTAGPGLIRHHTSNLRITCEASDRALGRCYFLVVTERGIDHWGRYHDEYGIGGDAWRFRSRHVHVEGVAPGSWAAERRKQGEPSIDKRIGR